MGLRTWIRKWFHSDRPVRGVENGSASPSPTAVARKPASQPVVVNGSRCRETHPSSDNEEESRVQRARGSDSPSLWDRAYDSVDSRLVQKYEKLLSTNLHTPGGTAEEHVDLDHVANRIERQDAKTRHDQMKQVTENCLQRLDERDLKYHIGSREYNLEDQVAKTVQVMQNMKGFIDEAVRASPEASLAWASVCLFLPIITNPLAAKQANEEGFTYVTSRMRFYVALEGLLWPSNCKNNSEGLKQVKIELEATIVDLYKHILNFQMRSVLRCYERRGFIFLRDLVQYDGWEGMVTEITKLEKRVESDSKQLNLNTSRMLFESMEESMSKYTGLMENLQSLSEKHLEISKQQLAVNKEQLTFHERAERRNQSEKESECHQLFRLARDDRDSSYEWYKNLVEDAIDGTCEWFLSREEFQSWEQGQSGILIVSADPGCGKSVLAKHLIDKRLAESSTICYFFFKDQLQNRENQALCALLHQLFSQRPQLIRHAMPEYRQNGHSLVKVTSALWDILWKATSDPDAGSVVIVLDALDECIKEERFDMINKLNGTFSENSGLTGKAKFLLTTRPYSQITSKFDELVDKFPHVHIPGESQSEMISQEVNRAIGRKVSQLTKLRPKAREYLQERLLAIENRTYLWVSLVIKFIETSSIPKTKDGVRRALNILPTSVNEAYERILSKCDGGDEASKALNLVLATVTPLSLTEMNIAMSVDGSTKSLEDLDLEDDKVFKARLRDMCGLFISIYDGKVHFIHQTARDFLVKKQPETSKTGRGYWNGTLNLQNAHLALAKSCIFYLDSDIALEHRQFSQYAVRNWIHHLRESQMVPQDELETSVLQLCDPSSDIHIRWPGLMGDLAPLCNKDSLWTAICLRLGNVVEMLIKHSDVDFESKHFGECTPLAYAAKEGYEDIVRILLASGRVHANARVAHRQTPVMLAIKGKKEAVAKVLLTASDIDLGARDETGRSVLSWAAMRGCVSIVQYLLACDDVDPNIADRNGKTPLFWAVVQEEILVVTLLLQSFKVDPNVKDKRGRTALSWATKHEQVTIQELLLRSAKTDPDLSLQNE